MSDTGNRTAASGSNPVLGAVTLIILAILGAVLFNGCGPVPVSTSGEPTFTSQVTATLGPSPTPKPSPSPKPSPTPTHTPKWTTIHTFKGYGNKKTTTFAVPNRWQLIWSCDPASDGGEYNLFVDVDSPDGTSVDAGAVLTTCQPGNTHDSTQEYQGGTVYLDVGSTGAWTIQVQVLK